MKEIKRKIYIEEEKKCKMCTLYEVLGKYGTHGSTLFYLFEKPAVGSIIKAIVSDNGQYDDDRNLCYAEIRRVEVYDIGSNGFIYVNRI